MDQYLNPQISVVTISTNTFIIQELCVFPHCVFTGFVWFSP